MKTILITNKTKNLKNNNLSIKSTLTSCMMAFGFMNLCSDAEASYRPHQHRSRSHRHHDSHNQRYDFYTPSLVNELENKIRNIRLSINDIEKIDFTDIDFLEQILDMLHKNINHHTPDIYMYNGLNDVDMADNALCILSCISNTLRIDPVNLSGKILNSLDYKNDLKNLISQRRMSNIAFAFASEVRNGGIGRKFGIEFNFLKSFFNEYISQIWSCLENMPSIETNYDQDPQLSKRERRSKNRHNSHINNTPKRRKPNLDLYSEEENSEDDVFYNQTNDRKNHNSGIFESIKGICSRNEQSMVNFVLNEVSNISEWVRGEVSASRKDNRERYTLNDVAIKAADSVVDSTTNIIGTITECMKDYITQKNK